MRSLLVGTHSSYVRQFIATMSFASCQNELLKKLPPSSRPDRYPAPDPPSLFYTIFGTIPEEEGRCRSMGERRWSPEDAGQKGGVRKSAGTDETEDLSRVTTDSAIVGKIQTQWVTR